MPCKLRDTVNRGTILKALIAVLRNIGGKEDCTVNRGLTVYLLVLIHAFVFTYTCQEQELSLMEFVSEQSGEEDLPALDLRSERSPSLEPGMHKFLQQLVVHFWPYCCDYRSTRESLSHSIRP